MKTGLAEHPAKNGASFNNTLSKAEYDIISEDIRNDIRQRKRDGYSLDYSGYIILNKHTVFYESYDDVNPEIVETITTKRIIDYGKRDIWISNYFNSLVGRKEFFGSGNRKRARKIANRIGIHGFDRIMLSEYA